MDLVLTKVAKMLFIDFNKLVQMVFQLPLSQLIEIILTQNHVLD